MRTDRQSQSDATALPPLNSRTVAILFGEGGRKAMSLATKTLPSILKGIGGHRDILCHCFQCGDWRSVRHVIWATTLYDRDHTKDWLKLLRTIFNAQHDQASREIINDVWKENCLPCLLGIIEGIFCIFGDWRFSEVYDKEIESGIVSDIILSDIKELCCMSASEIPSDFQGSIANSIKYFVKGSSSTEQECKYQERIKPVLEKIIPVMNKRNFPDDNPHPTLKCMRLSTVGRVILDQITYALFGVLSPRARAIAISYLDPNIIELFNIHFITTQ